MPADAQRAAARFELRGGIEAYCEVAARHLAPDGALSLVMDAERPERYERAIVDAGLHSSRVVTVLARAGGPARYLIYRGGWHPADLERTELTIRDADGEWTPAFLAVRERLALLGA